MTLPPRRIGIVGNREKKGARALVPALVRWLRERDLSVILERSIASSVRGLGPGQPAESVFHHVDRLHRVPAQQERVRVDDRAVALPHRGT